MTRDVYNKALDVLDKLKSRVDEAILQLDEIKRQEGIGFAKKNDEDDGYGLG